MGGRGEKTSAMLSGKYKSDGWEEGKAKRTTTANRRMLDHEPAISQRLWQTGLIYLSRKAR